VTKRGYVNSVRLSDCPKKGPFHRGTFSFSETKEGKTTHESLWKLCSPNPGKTGALDWNPFPGNFDMTTA